MCLCCSQTPKTSFLARRGPFGPARAFFGTFRVCVISLGFQCACEVIQWSNWSMFWSEQSSSNVLCVCKVFLLEALLLADARSTKISLAGPFLLVHVITCI